MDTDSPDRRHIDRDGRMIDVLAACKTMAVCDLASLSGCIGHGNHWLCGGGGGRLRNWRLMQAKAASQQFRPLPVSLFFSSHYHPLLLPASTSSSMAPANQHAAHTPAPLVWRPTKIMNMRDLSNDDDFISHLLVEKLGTGAVPLYVHKMDPIRRLPKTDSEELLQIVRRVSVLKMNPHLRVPLT